MFVVDLEIDMWVECDELGTRLAVCMPCLASCTPAVWTVDLRPAREVRLLAVYWVWAGRFGSAECP